MAKPPLLTIPSDDCIVTVNGETYNPHEGESVTLRPGLTVGEMLMIADFQRLGVELQAAAGEEDEAARTVGALEHTFGGLCDFIARRLVRWTWTDDAEQPLPAPTDPQVIRGLRNEEVLYLLELVKGESPAAKKNGSAPSRITSSATTSPVAASRSNGGRSHSRAS